MFSAKPRTAATPTPLLNYVPFRFVLVNRVGFKNMRRDHFRWAMLVAVAIVVMALALVAAMSIFRRTPEGVILNGNAVSSKQLVENLESGDPRLLSESLVALKVRRASEGLSKAVELLASQDDYVWVNAAHYLGSNNREESIPYLIKALRHSSHQGDSERLNFLKRITGENFSDFKSWQSWYINRYGEWQGDWNTYLGPVPRR